MYIMVIVDFSRYVDNDQYLYVVDSNNSIHNTCTFGDNTILNIFVVNLRDSCIYFLCLNV